MEKNIAFSARQQEALKALYTTDIEEVLYGGAKGGGSMVVNTNNVEQDDRCAAKQHKRYDISQHAHEHAWKPGQSGNPAGPPKSKVQFWRYVQQYSEMTDAQIDKIDRSKLSQSQKGALEYAIKLSQCEWQQVKEALDRDEGPIVHKVQAQVERPAVTPFSELPQAEQETRIKVLLRRIAGGDTERGDVGYNSTKAIPAHHQGDSGPRTRTDC